MSQFIPRTLDSHLRQLAEWFPVVSLTGPRQSGKSTLAKRSFPDFSYVTLEDPQTRAAALDDPVSFIRNRPDRLIIDEAQYAPDLFSMVQVVSDERGRAGQYVLTGSQNFLLMKSIGQSLAGRVGVAKLLPLAFRELVDAGFAGATRGDADSFAVKGGYPRLYSGGIPPEAYFPSYVDTYVERDVVGLLDVRQKAEFHRMLMVCAQNAGNLLNLTALARETGVSLPTVKSWLSILESSYLVFLLRPYHTNARKRLTKAPKLYFHDTGLLCHLLRIGGVDQLVEHPAFGAVFENLVVAETQKRHLNEGKQPDLCFYRDDSKREIDLLDLTDSTNVQAIEVKSSRTYHDKYARQMNSVCSELGIDSAHRCVVARVESSYNAKDCTVMSAEDWLMR